MNQAEQALTRDDEMLHVPEAARRLGLAESTLRRWVLLRKIPIVRLSPRAVRVPASAVEKILRQCSVPVAPGARE